MQVEISQNYTLVNIQSLLCVAINMGHTVNTTNTESIS